MLIVNGDAACTGSLIAPNLVLTARHCVAKPGAGSSECVGYGPTVTPALMQFYVGSDMTVAATDNVEADARGKTITVPATANLCSYDIAVVEIDRDLTRVGARIMPVRFAALRPDEPTVAIGYGVGGNDADRPARMQRSTKVLAVGPGSVSYAAENGAAIRYVVPPGDVVTGESTCYGDSGGPLLDADGNLVAVTSRGTQTPDDGTHGNGCIDAPSVYAGVTFNEATIRAAAVAAGHPLPDDPATAPPHPDDGASGDPSATNNRGSVKSKKTALADDPPAGCAAAPRAHGPGRTRETTLILGLALAFAARRRRLRRLR